MKKLMFLVTVVVFVGEATAAPKSPLIGVWGEVNGSGTARIQPCAYNQNLCAIGLSRRAAAPPIETGIVLSAIRPAGQNRWRGTYHDGKRKLPASLRLTSHNRVEMKVCIAFLCQTATYNRQR